MVKYKKYKIAVIILAVCVIVETVLLLHFWKAALRKPTMPVQPKARIALVIDDWGYNLDNLDILRRIDYPLTISVLPNLPYSRVIAQKASEYGREVILHLPLEPREKYRLEKKTVLVSMDEPTIINILNKDLEDIGPAKGVSNHMGSWATKDIKTMSVIFKELKRKGLYFLDSLVSAKSVCQKLAGKIQLRFAKRDVFIDNQQDPGYIKAQVHKLKTRARVYGQAIGIGHDHKTTLKVLEEVMPELDKEGYKFVFVSELVR